MIKKIISLMALLFFLNGCESDPGEVNTGVTNADLNGMWQFTITNSYDSCWGPDPYSDSTFSTEVIHTGTSVELVESGWVGSITGSSVVFNDSWNDAYGSSTETLSLTVTSPTMMSGSYSEVYTDGTGSCSYTSDVSAVLTTPVTVSIDGVGTLTGNVNDIVASLALDGVSVTLTDSNGTTIDSAITDISGSYSLSANAGGGYTLAFDIPGYIAVTFEGITIYSGEQSVIETINQIDNTFAGIGDISGHIVDATTGFGVPNASITVREGLNNTTGVAVDYSSTDASGDYSITGSLSAGNYTLGVELSGYVASYINVYVVGGLLIDNQNGSISPIVAAGETSIVLTWGAAPYDLDSHLTGPTSDNSVDRFHVYFGSRGSLTSAPYANLDVDDTYSYGPETITITNQYQGVYRYSVLDYTNQYSTTNTELSNSGASIAIYQGGGLVRTYNVPAGVGTLWTVFELNGGTITTVNTLENHSDGSYAVRNLDRNNSGHLFRNRRPSDAAIMNNMPAK